MSKINICYRIIVYKDNQENSIIENQAFFDSNMFFSDVIETIVKENNILFKFQIYVKNLKTRTWGKFFDDSILSFMSGDDFHYKWLNYQIDDIQSTFNLFDEFLDIVIDGPGIGRTLKILEGIKFVIHSNEKEIHKYEPHIHCIYSGQEMRIRIDTLKIMKGDKAFTNKKKVKLAKKWIMENQKKLLEYYELFVVNGKSFIDFEAFL